MTTTTRAVEFTVSLADGVAELAETADLLGRSGVNVRGYAFETLPSGSRMRVIVDEPDEARSTLTEEGYDVEERPAIVTAVPHEPGELGRVARKLASEGQPVASSYLVVEPTSGLPQLVFSFTEELPAELGSLASQAE